MASNIMKICSHPLVLILVFTCLARIHFCHSFTIDLIHKDSPHSPLYNPGETPSRRLKQAIKRSRAHSLTSSPVELTNAADIDVTADNGGYLMKMSIGTPPQDFYGVVDTGSDLLWLKCLPCDGCSTTPDYPLFNPAASSSYKDIPCGDNACNTPVADCSQTSNTCSYSYGYEGGEYSKGVMAKETVTFGTASIEDITFGCAHIANTQVVGIVGLSLGPASIVNQIGARFGARKFSHCLVPFHSPQKTSKLILGSEAIVSGPNTIMTPITQTGPGFYSITLNGISVDGNFVSYSCSSTEAQKANMIVDSGSTQPVIPIEFYNRLTEEVKGIIPLSPSLDDGRQLCYRSTDHNFVPTFTAHFDGGDLELKSNNIFIPQYPDEDLFCFAITHLEGSSDIGVYGNLFQYNYLMGFDIDNMMLSIKPTDCTMT